jgi:hypothetical protein
MLAVHKQRLFQCIFKRRLVTLSLAGKIAATKVELTAGLSTTIFNLISSPAGNV